MAESLARRYDSVRPHLTERQRRAWLGAEARELGSAGVRVVADADKLVDPETRGDPMTPLRWTSKSLRTLAGQLRAEGHQPSASLVQRLLHEAG